MCIARVYTHVPCVPLLPDQQGAYPGEPGHPAESIRTLSLPMMIPATWRFLTLPCVPAAFRPQVAPSAVERASWITVANRVEHSKPNAIVHTHQLHAPLSWSTAGLPRTNTRPYLSCSRLPNNASCSAMGITATNRVSRRCHAHPGRGRLTVTVAAAAALRLSGAAGGSGRFQHRMEPP